MPLANVQQVIAPEFSGVGTLLRGANDSFNNAFASANGILAQYQEGQQAKGDAMFLENIKGATDEKSLTDILGKMDFTKLNLTPEMQKVALGMRDTVLGYDTTRIENRNSIDMNSRANAGENRTQTDWVYGNTARDAMNAATPGIIEGYVGNLTTGQPAQGNTGGGSNRRYDLSAYGVEGGSRPDAMSGMTPDFNSGLGAMIEAAPPEIREQLKIGSGFRSVERQEELWKAALEKYGSPEAARKWVAPPGNSQHNHGNAADLKFASDEAKAWVHANAGNFGLAFPLSNEPWHIELATARGGGATPGPNGYTGGQQNGYMQSPSMLAGLDAIRKLAASGTLPPEAATGLVDTLTGAQVAGQTSINDRDAADQALRAAAAQNQIALDPTIMNDTQRQAAMLTTPGLNPLTAQKGAGDLNTLTAPGGALGAIATPAVTADPTVQAAVEQQNAVDQLALSVSSEARKQDVLKKFTSAEDPVAALVEQANETGGGSIFAWVDLDEDTRKAVQTLADAAGVSVPQMAATLADMTDPSTEQRGWGLNNRPPLEALLGSVQDGGLGGLRQFFNDPTGNSPSGKNAIIAQAKKDAALAAGYTGKSTANLKSTANREATQNRIQTTQSQIAKLQAINPSDPQITVLQKQLQDLKQGLFDNATPTQDAIARVKMYTPGSPDHVREVAALSAAIDADPGIKNKASMKKALGIAP